MKVQALFKKAAAPAKSAPAKKGAKSAPVKKASGSSKTGGWLGSNSQEVALDKW